MKLSATKREKLGKIVKTLRVEGSIPAVVYGKGFENLNVTLNLKEFKKVYKEAGHSSVVDLAIDGQEESLKVLITDLQEEPIKNEFIHVDFHKVDLSQKTTAEVPVEVTGLSPIVKSGEGILLTLLSKLEVEALPLDLPHQILVDVTPLEKIGDGITVAQLPIDHSKVTVVGHTPEDLVVKIDYAVQLEKEEEAKNVEDIEVLKEKKEELGAEGEEGAETTKGKESAGKEEAKSEKEEKKEKK